MSTAASLLGFLLVHKVITTRRHAQGGTFIWQ